MTKKQISMLIILVVVAIVGGVVWGVQEQSKPQGQPQDNISNISQDQLSKDNDDNSTDDLIPISDEEPIVITSNMNTSNWQTYRNEELGFGFKYPREWGEAELLRGTQIRVYPNPQNLGNHKILININNDREGFQYIKAENTKELASISINSSGCSTSLSKNILLKNEKYLNVRIGDPQEWLSQEDCLKLYESIPEERVGMFAPPNAGGVKIAILKENEIPQAMRSDYELFKKVVETFVIF